MNNPRIIVSLDFPDRKSAIRCVQRLSPGYCRLKVGKELFTSSGPALVKELVGDGFDIFLDLKYHDVLSTVAKACSAAAKLGVWMLSVHASGGASMLKAAREAINQESHQPLLIGVSVLTGMSADDLSEVGVQSSPAGQVRLLASLCKQSALDGVVCSAQEAPALKQEFGSEFILVTPGIRPSGRNKDDQKRVMSPAEAMAAGSDYLVIGRPVTRAKDPLQALLDIQAEISDAVKKCEA